MKKSVLLTSFLMLFVSFISLAQPSNDSIANAIDVSSLISTCSSDQAFTNIGATSDSTLASCGSPSGNNVWFKFQATDTIISILVDRGGTKGSIKKLVVALFDSTISPLSQLTCESAMGQYDDVDIDYLHLTIGEWYYFSIDNYSTTAGTFTLCLSTSASYDYYEGAVDLTPIMDSTTLNGEYTTKGATSDLTTGSCNDAGDYNRWFKFQASAANISILLRRGGIYGGLKKANMALWEADGTTEFACAKYIGQYDNVTLSALGLTIGDWYYLSVDNSGSTNRGSFTLSLSTTLDYDFYQGAKDISYLFVDTCSANSEFTTIGATSDLSTGSCGDAGDYNRWFKFQATAATVNVLVKRGGIYGGLRKVNLALWDSTGTVEISCSKYNGQYDNVDLNALNLIIGDWYYISVDNFGSTNQGSFTLCLSDQVSYDFYEGAKDVTSLIGTCSPIAAYTTLGATSDKSTGSCNDAGNYNRWFKFQATTPELSFVLKRGGAFGGLRKANMTLWESDGTTEVACAKYVGTYDNIKMSDVALVVGDWYYISVDNKDANNRGSFTLCLYNYDFFEGAKDLTSFIGGCSPDAEYTTVGATMDQNAGSCNNASGYNRWFKFQASNTKMSVKVDRGGTKGSVRYVNATMWEADGVSEIACNRYVGSEDDVFVEANSLIVGDWYYISVDNYSSSWKGSFTMCLDTNLTYDFHEGAKDISSIIGSCSADAEYTTKGATADMSDGSCGNSGNYNRWFKFQAISPNMQVTVQRGGTKGNIRYINITLWDSSGMGEIACNRYVASTDNVVVEALGLTVGEWYSISVDNYSSSWRGSFTLCLDTNLSYDFYEGAIDVTALIDSCSADAEYTTVGATPDKNSGSCNNAGNYNRWFKFQASTTEMNIKVERGGTKGNIRYVNIAVWDTTGNSEIACNKYVASTDVVEVAAQNLTPGEWYYISVDNYSSSWRGSFTLCLNTDLSYDYYEGAIDISSYIGTCTPDAAYTTVGATEDMSTGSCGNAGFYNRWFKFQATGPELNLSVKRGGTQGNIRYINAVIWEADGQSEVACNRYVNSTDNVDVLASGLVTGDWYYISVDNYSSSWRGTFTLCLDTTPTYDFYGGAIELTDLNNYCSADAEYTTVGATPDMNGGSCGNAGNYNRWFKFTAVDSVVTYTIKRGGTFGNIRYINTALWEADGTTEVACAKYVASTDDVTITDSNLTPGNEYYISVDNYSSSWRGTFTICINNIGAPFYSRATGNWNTASTWSNDSINGPAALTAPGTGSIVYIDGYTITLTADDTCAEVNMDVTNGSTSLILDAAKLSVMGVFNQLHSNTNNILSVSLINGGDLSVNDNYNFARNGGTSPVLFAASTGSDLLVNGDFLIETTNGSGTSNVLSFTGTSSFTVNGEMKMSQYAGGNVSSDLQLSNTATGEIFGNFTYDGAADNMLSVTLNNDASITLHSGIVKVTSGRGKFTGNDNSTIKYLDIDLAYNFVPSYYSGTTDSLKIKNIEYQSINPQSALTISTHEVYSGTATFGANFAYTVAANASVTVDGAITNNGVVTIQDGASLVQTAAGANGNTGLGTYHVNQTGTSSALTYNVWSSPIQNANILSSFTGTNACDIYAFEADSQAFKYDYANGFSTSCLGNPVTFGANDVVQGGDGVADVARGYFIPNGSSASKSFTGNVNNGDITASIVTTNIVNDPLWNGNDWNLIGNPYPSGLNATSFWNENTTGTPKITDAIYFWDVNEYASWNLSGGVGTGFPNASGSGVTPDGVIGVAQGFFVVAAADVDVTFNNAMRDTTNNQFFKTEIENHNVWVSVKTPSGSANAILVGYTNEATNDFDPLYDAHKLSGNANIRFSSMLNNEEFVIQSFAPLSFGGQKVIPLTVFTAETGTHTFSEVKRENIGSGMTIYLRDTKTGMEYDLTKGDYTVELDANTTNTRFELVFTNNDATTSVKETVKSNYLLLATGEGYVLQNNEGINGDIQVIDVTGKVVWTKNNVNSNQVSISLDGVSSGIYFLNVLNNNQRAYTTKLVKH